MNIHKGFMFSSFIISCFSLTFYIISASTNHWINAKATYFDLDSSEVINYGLFSGKVIRQVLVTKWKYELTVVCDFSEGVCLYSCQDDSENRNLELNKILKGEKLDPCPSKGAFTPTLSKLSIHSRFKRNAYLFSGQSYKDSWTNSTETLGKECIPAAYWLSTVLFYLIAISLTVTSAVFALINSVYRPVEPICNVFGLYIWNTAAAVSSFITLVLWAGLLFQHLVDNVAISDTLNAAVTFISKDNASLGSSYFISITGLFFNLTNIGCLVLRNYLIKKNAEPPTLTIDNNESPLEFY